jgi:hypothetical protein
MGDRLISRFWKNYIAKLKSYGIKPYMVRRHVTHAAHTFTPSLIGVLQPIQCRMWSKLSRTKAARRD